MAKDSQNGRSGLVLFILLFLGTAGGLLGGVGCYTFLYAKGISYLGDAPETCANCHVMQEYLDAWIKSSHKHVAVCNDCTTPHNTDPCVQPTGHRRGVQALSW